MPQLMAFIKSGVTARVIMVFHHRLVNP